MENKNQIPAAMLEEATGAVIRAKRISDRSETYARAVLGAAGVADLLAALEGITDELGFAEWASPEHAEEILNQLIDRWYGKASITIARAKGEK